MVEERVDVVEDVFFGDGGVGVVLAELGDSGVIEVGEGEALGTALRQMIANLVSGKGKERPVSAALEPKYPSLDLWPLVDTVVEYSVKVKPLLPERTVERFSNFRLVKFDKLATRRCLLETATPLDTIRPIRLRVRAVSVNLGL